MLVSTTGVVAYPLIAKVLMGGESPCAYAQSSVRLVKAVSCLGGQAMHVPTAAAEVTFRDGCLGVQWFKNRIDAKILIGGSSMTSDPTRASAGSRPQCFRQKLSTMNPEPAIS